MTEEIKAHVRVLNPLGNGVDGRVIRVDGAIALVAFDDGSKSMEIPTSKLTPKRGRPVGSGVREPVDVKPLPVKRCLAEVVAAEMKEQGLTWDALAERSGVSRATIARVVKGNGDGQRIDTIEALARSLGIHPGAFWGGA